MGLETGTCLTLPAQFEEQRRSPRLHEVPQEKLMLRETAVLDAPATGHGEVSRLDPDVSRSGLPEIWPVSSEMPRLHRFVLWPARAAKMS